MRQREVLLWVLGHESDEAAAMAETIWQQCRTRRSNAPQDYSCDARHNLSRTRIVIGRDAVDVALTTIDGATGLVSLQVWADAVDNSAVPSIGRFPNMILG